MVSAGQGSGMSEDEFPDEGPDQPSIDEIDIPLRETTFCVIDLETTGTGAEARITEIGAVKVMGGEVLGEFQTLINPGVVIPTYITSLTGISNATVAFAPPLSQVFPSLVQFCSGCVMVAHNARFDMGFILRAAKGLGYEWPSTAVLDTVMLARRIIPRSEVPNYKLGTLAGYFSTTVEPSHRALDDARATVDVLHGLLERVGNQGVGTLHDLLYYSQAISRTRRAKRSLADGLPEGPGVYSFVRQTDSGPKVLYVGTSKHIRRRVATYFTAAETRRRMDEMVALAHRVEAVECHTALEAAIVELRLITAHQPPYNRRGKHPSLTWVKVTTEPIPRFSVVRKVSDDQAGYCGPFPGSDAARQAVLALMEAFPLRACKDRLSLTQLREPCALAEMGSCSAPCSGQGIDGYLDLAARARQCFSGDIRPVRDACMPVIGRLSDELRYEQAAEALERVRWVEYGMRRRARIGSLADCPHMVAARRLGAHWEIHVFRHGQLAAAGVAHEGEDPSRVADDVVATAKTVSTGVPRMPAGSIAEAELVAGWLEQPGVRLLDVQGTWGWPTNTA